MAYIHTGIERPGIIELFHYKHNTGNALSSLAHELLVGPSPLSSADRELIAMYVSYLNECEFCHLSHAAAVNAHLEDEGETVRCVLHDLDTANITDKMKQLLKLASKVQRGGKYVQKEDVEDMRKVGVSDEEIHDTVLIAAAFCMFNRYVDGLGTKPASREEYIEMGRRMTKGYRMS